ncbi:MAG: cation-translocating P-type ATPase [Anaerolineae bacterium]|nr:cation-translocating P-type ATPase [Anaerolineae bacterium]
MTSKTDWHLLTPDEVTERFGTKLTSGLRADQVRAASARFGLNELVEAPGASMLELIWNQIKNVLVLMLIGAAIVALLIGETRSALAIAVIVAFNTALGVWQEARAEKAMAALKRMAAPIVRVRRDGQIAEIAARDLVPGDVIVLEAGSTIPADARVIESVNLRVREAALTGEATTVSKTTAALKKPGIPLGDRTNMLFMGTEVTHGRGEAVVVGTGMDTELGRIAALLQGVRNEPTPLQRRMTRLGQTLVGSSLALIVVILGIGLLVGAHMVGEDGLLLSVISIAVAVVPEGLPAVITIALALGAQRMVRRHVLIRRLPAVETLGSVTTICSDKTGTLTQNKMIVEVAHTSGQDFRFTGQGYDIAGQILSDEQPVSAPDADLNMLLTAAVACNDATLLTNGQAGDIVGDPTEGALLVAAAKAGITKDGLRERMPRVGEAPFTSERKRMSVVVQPRAESRELGAPYLLFSKGSPELVLQRCTHALSNGQIVPLNGHAEEALRINDEMAGNGVRVLGFAYKPLSEHPAPGSEETYEEGMIWLGLMGMIDAPRPEVRDAVAVSRAAGIRPIMITGDHGLTALAIARDLGIAAPGNDRVVTGPELEKMSDSELEQVVGDVSVYARVAPEHKLRIVKALQARGQFAAMTGDGVNDAPALKQANIGVAMGITGTDVTKEASDMILTDDNFASIIAAAEEGRTIYGNVRKFVKYILTSNIGEVITLAAAPVLGLGGVPLLPVQILYMNIVTDGLPALALAVDPAESDVMKRSPYHPKESIFSRGLGAYMLRVGVVFGLMTVAFMLLVYRISPQYWQTMVFTMLSLSQMGHALAVRSERESIFKVGFRTNPWLLLAVLATVVLQLALMYVEPMAMFFGLKALPLPELLFTFAASTLLFFWIEGEKWVMRRRARPARTATQSASQSQTTAAAKS